MADPQVQANDEQEIAEAQNSLTDLLYDVVAQGATTRLGGFVYRRIDSVLSTVEKTAKWSLPQPVLDGGDEASSDGSKISAPPLIRPLPWMLFLPALVVMRMVRVGLSLLALMVGRPPVTPASVVHFVQNKRRKLRALKYRGQKLGRISRAEAKAEDELQTTWLSRIIMPLRTIVCRPGRVVVTPHRHHHRHPQRQQNQQQDQQQPGRKRNAQERDVDDDDESGPEVDEGTVSELLDKYADDAGDSSFHADSASGESSDSSLSEQEKSAVEDVPSKPASESAKKESNGHAPKEGSQARRKSDLNVESAPKPAENGSVDSSKKQDATKEPAAKEPEKAEVKEDKPKATENGSTDGSKSQDAAKEERQKQEANKPKLNSTASDSERTDSKQTSVAGQKNQQEEDAAKNQSMSDVKTNFQQKNKQQQPNQPQNQPQQTNANGGTGGKKQKRPSQGHQ
ncbi:transcriptional regulator ATRX homolog [Culex quinquefasciatus]|uniref:transcriptional regulator ATRX homolog n=1 Tax=Culex quinquefasciatus TaxID=7176 RepID=UPI0018E3106B|nr:transcriptional regulator ATRX homolog [Culex quinquefasciatus]XP_038120462.1 transcriptional regulator ATRX homolog [Culex quinquefasciatus]